MTTQKKNSYFISGLLFTVMVLASINLISCGGGGNSSPVIYSIASSAGVADSKTGTITPANTTLIGANFGTTQGPLSHVFFGGVNAGAAGEWTDTTIVVSIPKMQGLTAPNTSPAQVVVSVNGQVSNAVTFTYIGS